MPNDQHLNPFNAILDQLDEATKANADGAARALQAQQFADIDSIVQHGQKIADFQTKVKLLESEWQEINGSVAVPSREKWHIRAFSLNQLISAIKAIIARLNRPMLLIFLFLFIGQWLFKLDPSGQATLRNKISVGFHILALAIGAWSLRRQDTAIGDGRVRWEGWIVLLLVTSALLLRIVALNNVPFIVDGDAAASALDAVPFAQDRPNTVLFATGWHGNTNVYFWLIARFLKLFGITIVGMRMFSVVGGVLGVITIYWMGRTLFNPRIGILAGSVTSILPFHLIFSRNGLENIHMTWLVALVISLMWYGWQRHSKWLFLLAGGFAGLAQYFYPGAQLIPILMFCQILCLLAFPLGERRDWRLAVIALFTMLIGFVLAYLPMISFFLQHPKDYMARNQVVSILSTGWLEKEMVNRSWSAIMWDLVRRCFGVWLFPVPHANLWFFDEQFLSPFSTVLFAFGLLGVCFSKSIPRWLRAFVILYLVIGIFLAGVMTTNSPTPSRYVIFLPIVIVLIAWSLDRIIAQFDGLSSFLERGLVALIILLLLLSYGVNQVRHYVNHDTKTAWERIEFNSALATSVTRYLISLPNQDYTLIYLNDAGNYFKASPTVPLFSMKTGIDLPPNIDCLTLTQSFKTGQNVVIAPVTRLSEIDLLTQRIWGGEVEYFYNHRKDVLAAVWRFNLPDPALAPLVCPP